MNQKLFYEILLRIKKVIGELSCSNLSAKKCSNASPWHFGYNFLNIAHDTMIFILPESYNAKISKKSNINESCEVFMEIWSILSISMNHWNIFLAHSIYSCQGLGLITESKV